MDGFLMQKTNFLFEILIHDDASSDGTQKIIHEYQQKYPNIIKPVYQKENQFSKGIYVPFYLFSLVKGKYVAICEGDDYWIDPMKLQKQVDFLESNSNFSLVFSNRLIISDNGKLIKQLCCKNVFTQKDLLGGEIIGLQTICYRSEYLLMSNRNYLNVNGDMIWPYLCSLKGKLYCLPDVTSVYRRTGFGLASSRDSSEILKISLKHMWNFHKAVNSKSMHLLVKAQARYVYSDIISNIRKRNIFGWKAAFVEFNSYPYSSKIISNIILLFYLLYFFTKNAVRKRKSIFK